MNRSLLHPSFSRVCVRSSLSLILAATLLFSAAPGQVATILADTAPPNFLFEWNSEDSTAGALDLPFGVGLDPHGNVYVADSVNDRVQVFSSTGAFIRTWGSTGTADGNLSFPNSVAIHTDGAIYVVDSGNHRLQLFTWDAVGETYQHEATWGGPGSGSGPEQFFNPSDVAVAPNGTVYVADTSNYRIQMFDGVDWTTFAGTGAPSADEGELNSPGGVAVDANGNVYVADSGNDRIQVFDSSQTFVTSWGTEGAGQGQFDTPRGVDVDADGKVYVADTNNHRMQVFENDGTFLTEWGLPGDVEGAFNSPSSVAVSAFGTVYVADMGNNRIQAFAWIESPPDFLTSFGTEGEEDGEFNQPRGVAVDPDGRVYVSDTFNNRIQRFTWNASTGEYEHDETWGGPDYGSEPGQFHSPRGITSDSQGNIYVAENQNRRIQKFDPDASENPWTVIADTTKPFTTNPPPGEFFAVSGVAVEADGTLYTVDSLNDGYRIQAFTCDVETGEYEYSQGWKVGSTVNDRSYRIAVDSHGHVYAAEYGVFGVQKFDREGNFIAKWGSEGTGDGQFGRPYGIAIDAQEYVYVAEYFNHRVQKFTANGVYRTKWGGQGAGEGEFFVPSDLAVGNDGRIYVADTSNHRIQVFSYARELDIELAAGWNMVSVPLQLDPEHNTPADVFPEAEAVFTWNAVNKNYTRPTTIEPCRSYWVRVPDETFVTITGTHKDEWTCAIAEGWNMVGSISETTRKADLQTTGSAELGALYYWRATNKAYGSSTTIDPTVGYWLMSSANCDLTMAVVD